MADLLITTILPSSKSPGVKEPDPTLKITIVSLNGDNYIVWAKSASLYLCRKRKLEYINGKAVRFDEFGASFSEWEANIRTVMS